MELLATSLAYGLPEPVYEATQGGMVVTVFKESVGNAQVSLDESKVQGESEGVNVGVYVGVNVGVNDLLSYIQSHPGQRAGEMAIVFKLTKRTIERWLKKLKETNEIEFRGTPKTGGYFLTAKEAPSTR